MERTLAFYASALRTDLTEYCKEAVCQEEITRAQLHFLLYIVKHPGCSPGQAAAAMGADAGHTTRTVDKLVQAGCVCRNRDKADRRTVVLYATEKGEALFQKTKGLFQEWDREVLAVLTEEERRTMLAALEKIVRSRLEQHPDLLEKKMHP